MKFSCEKLLLQNAVNTASRAVAAKSSIPALEGLLLTCGGESAVQVGDGPIFGLGLQLFVGGRDCGGFLLGQWTP